MGGIILLGTLVQKCHAQTKPFVGMANVTDWVHAIEEKDDIRKMDSKIYYTYDWFDALNREPVIWGKHRELNFKEVQAVNVLINNAFPGAFDKDTYNTENYTATPLEISNKGQGDCEDYAIIKYYLLAFLGTRPERMNIYAGYYIIDGKPIPHVVLAVELGDKSEWILDVMHDNPVKAKDYMNKEFMPKHRIDNKRVSIW